jgi:hypothetical protein
VKNKQFTEAQIAFALRQAESGTPVAEIILPGVAHIDTMADHHSSLITKLLTEGRDPGIGIATFKKNMMRLDVVEAARMAGLAGLDVKIDTVMNGRGQTTDLFVGDPADAHAEGVKLAREVYATKAVEGSNVIILNSYSKANEAVLAIPLLEPLLGDRPPDLVLISNAPEGQVTHYLVRSFGEKVGGRLLTAPLEPLQNINTFIILTPYIEIAGADWLAAPESIIWARTWPEVLKRLTETHGDSAKVAVVPDATMQYFAE